MCTYLAVPVVELVDVLDVPEHNVVLVGETRWDVFRATGHLPEVRLQQEAKIPPKPFS